MSEIAAAAEAENAIARVADLIGKLQGVIEQETALVHAGKIRKAATISPAKSELAGQLFTAAEWLKTNAKFLLRAAPASAARCASCSKRFKPCCRRT